MASRIEEICDYTAARAAGITGISAVFGSGAGSVDDPLRSGEKVRPAPGAPTQEFEHWSEVAALTSSEWLTQEGAMQVTWLLPMRLWFVRSDLGRLRQVAQPYFTRYLSAFQGDPTLGDMQGLLARVVRMELGEDPPQAANRARWGFLDVTLEVSEVVDP